MMSKAGKIFLLGGFFLAVVVALVRVTSALNEYPSMGREIHMETAIAVFLVWFIFIVSSLLVLFSLRFPFIRLFSFIGNSRFVGSGIAKKASDSGSAPFSDVLSFGILAGMALGAAMCIVALDHNPQGEYTDNPEGLVFIFYAWTAAVSFPFSLIHVIIHFIKTIRK